MKRSSAKLSSLGLLIPLFPAARLYNLLVEAHGIHLPRGLLLRPPHRSQIKERVHGAFAHCVTGMGAVTPVGNTAADSWHAVCAGTSGITRISRFDTTGFAVQIAGEVKDFDARLYVDAREVRRMDRFTQYAVAAAQEAMDDSGVGITAQNSDRIGVFVGSGIGGIESLESQFAVMAARGPSRLSPFLIPMLLTDTAAGAISIRFGLRGPNLAVVSACATGAHAVGEGAAAIRRGDADVMICGSSEAAVTPMTIAGFAAMRALSRRNDAPGGGLAPFRESAGRFYSR